MRMKVRDMLIMLSKLDLDDEVVFKMFTRREVTEELKDFTGEHPTMLLVEDCLHEVHNSLRENYDEIIKAIVTVYPRHAKGGA